MKLTAEILNEKHELELKLMGERVEASVDERRYELELRELGPGAYLLIEDGRVKECRVEADGAERGLMHVAMGKRAYDVNLIDPKRLRSAGTAGAHADASAQIVAPMPGKVVRVLVEVGAVVEAGQGLLVVEAMKMQNEMKSPRAGTLVELNTRTGATVNAGQVLAVVE